MIFTTPEQALTYVTKNFQAITEPPLEPQKEACKYIAAWIVSKQGDRDVRTIKNALRLFSREINGSKFITLNDVLDSDAFKLGEFYDDDEDWKKFVRWSVTLEFKKNCERLGLFLD